jgi:hypothetical protein
LKYIENDSIRKRRYFTAEVKIQIDSVIISSIPSIFNVLESKHYQLLYRGSRDGFYSKALHQRVDSHSHTLTIVETMKGLLFTLKNPLKPDLACNASNNSHNRGLDHPKLSFVNETGLPASTLFTGEETFTVKDLGIFEVSV